MENRNRTGTPGWKRGLLTAVVGIGMVLAAGAYREQTAEQERTETLAVYDTAESVLEEKKKIALTFDDGPHPVYTEQLLDGLSERNVKATFFLLGCNIEGNEEIVRRIAEEGHLLGNHTFYHVDITKLSREEACAEILDTSSKITEITAQPVEYVRPPFGNWNQDLECEVMMIPVFWTVDTLDWSTRNADRLVEEVMSEVEENDIILMHDSYDSTVKAALRIIDLLQAQGYEFVTVDELILE